MFHTGNWTQCESNGFQNMEGAREDLYFVVRVKALSSNGLDDMDPKDWDLL